VCGPRAPRTPTQGGCPTLPPREVCYVSGHDPSPTHAGGHVTPDSGIPPHTCCIRELTYAHLATCPELHMGGCETLSYAHAVVASWGRVIRVSGTALSTSPAALRPIPVVVAP